MYGLIAMTDMMELHLAIGVFQGMTNLKETLLERGYENKLSDSIITARHLGESIESYNFFSSFSFHYWLFIGKLHTYLKCFELISSQKKKK